MIPRLWYWTDSKRGTAGRELAEVIEAAARGGVGGVVLREPALAIEELAALLDRLRPLRSAGVKLVVSRRLDLVRAYDLDGIQLGADAVPVAEVRASLGPAAIVGYSAHSAEEAREVAAAGASYVTLSPIYPTSSKPGVPGRGLEWLAGSTRLLSIPALALGGVTAQRTPELIRAGAWGVAVVSAIGAAPDVESAARKFRDSLQENPG